MSYSLDQTFNARMDDAKQAELDRTNRGQGRSTWKPFKRTTTEAQARRRFNDGEREQMKLDALRRAEDGASVTNYPAIYSGFMAKGIAESDINPRVNVFTFQAWKAKGRSVKKGEHGVKVVTFIPFEDKDTGEVTGKRPWTSTVFHISQTEPTADAEARWAARKAEGGKPKANPFDGAQFCETNPAAKHNGDRWIES